jgi:hypothetical protein
MLERHHGKLTRFSLEHSIEGSWNERDWENYRRQNSEGIIPIRRKKVQVTT